MNDVMYVVGLLSLGLSYVLTNMIIDGEGRRPWESFHQYTKRLSREFYMSLLGIIFGFIGCITIITDLILRLRN